ncbi:metal-dependent hydrolase [Noviherbaspirillum saxi]|uniref:Metal-dependent hydrolase n=1 Tax=Noviherbaspirillum saxi TaxID=2320863 RepID=A0A3A3FJP7_9BURK|nr:metal-dependent hydrolase [Noviherbaspirillum saxi]RJF91702.1 metal-dependent hydrolase [Noviherbaspirillum saxi]
MKVRFPKWDFSKVRAHWAPSIEFSQRYNAASTVPAHIEPYLVKVMMQAKKVLDPKHTKLHEDLDIFIKQEVQHCKQHLAFNRALYAQGYEGMKAIEDPYREDYDRFLKEKSLRFNLAYAEGFEAMGSASALVFFEDLDDLLEGADQDAVDLWKWHLAEEFEHREVAFQVYQAICGRGFFSWLYRVYGLFYAVKHIRTHTARLEEFLMNQDRKSMSPEEVQRSIERQKVIAKKVAKASLPRMLGALSPFYDPAKKVPPAGMELYWQQY